MALLADERLARARAAWWPGEYARRGLLCLRFGLLVLLWIPLSYSQQYPFIPVGAPNAPQGCMFPFEDHNGGLWLAGCEAGSEGIYYFDGSRFLSPLKDPFPKVVVRGMAEDTDGGLWIASSGGVCRLAKGHLQKKFDGIAIGGILQVAPDVFLTTVAHSTGDYFNRAALTRISRVQGEWKADTLQEPVPQVQYTLDHNGHVVYACGQSYCELSAEGIVSWRPGVLLAATRHDSQTGINYDAGPSMVLRDRFDCVWWRSVGTVTYQCPSDQTPVNLPANLASLGFPSMFELADGTIGIPSYGKLLLGRPQNFHVLTPANGYPNALIVVPGREGSFLISTTSGLYILPRHVGMESWSARDGLNGTVWSVVHSGKSVFALADVSNEILDSDRTRWHRLDAPGGRLSQGPNGTVFVATTYNAVYQMSPTWKTLRHSPSLSVWLLAKAPDSSLWAGGSGVFRLTPNGGDIGFQPEAPNQQFLQGMAFDQHGDLWTCSTAGLSQLHGKEWRTISTKDGLLENSCASMSLDSQGDIWYAYNSLPVFALIHDPGSARPVIRQFQNEGAKTRTYFFASDHRGWLWRGTPDGVYVADPQQARQGQWLHLNRVDGLPAVDTNQHSFFEDSDGSIWFGAEDSVIHLFPPDDLLHPDYLPSVFVSSFSLDGSAPQMASMTSDIRSGADIVAHVGSLQFDRRNALLLRYRVLPEQSSWTTQRALDIPLGKLHSGKHTLEVQAQLGSGPWSTAVSQSLTVLKPIWLTWPALLGFVATGGLGVVGARRWRQKRAQRAAKTLPALGEWRLQALSPEVWPLAGAVLDSRFEVGPILARGGFATVAQGKDLQQGGRACAIKIFRQDLMDKDWVTRRFQQEVRALEKILHPNVVRIYGHGMTPIGSPYLVMEFVAGDTLRERLESGSLQPQQTADYLRQAGDALEEIHRHGICHRDLKPENLMIRDGASSGHELVLIDFSIAIVQDPDVTVHGLSRAAGTIYYMAPEQSIGYADSSTDVYSLAKILIEMMTGERLTTLLPDASMDLPDRVREKLAALNLGLSPASIDYISSALEFDPSRRPKSAQSFANQIANDLSSVQNRA